MDNIEVLSDCSESSKYSGGLSILSSLSDYRGEFLELKHLIDPEKYSELVVGNGPAKKSGVILWYEERIHNLNSQLQNSLKQNEKYKNALYNLEKKNELSRNEKIEQLLSQNNQLKINLETANKQIQRLIDINNNKTNHQTTVTLENKILNLEKCNHDLNLQNCLISNELNHCKYQKNEIESDYKTLKSEINDLKLELAAKTNCVSELKNKISEQHVDLQKSLQSKVKLSHMFESLSVELEFVKKSETWYKNELHQLQKDKTNLMEQIVENKRILSLQEKELEFLKLQLNKSKCEFEETRINALKEKENILKQIESVSNNCIVTSESGNVTPNNVNLENLTSHYEMIINELTNDVLRIKANFENQQNSLEKMTKENSELLSKYLSLQNSMKTKEDTVETLENNIKDLKMKLAGSMDKEREYDAKLLHLQNVNSGLQIELRAKNQEKEDIEQSVKTIKDQFKVFKISYEDLKNKLHEKNQEVLQLELDKQELYMNNNWKTCELEKIKQKDIEINKLKEKLTLALRKCDDLKEEIDKQSKEIESLGRVKIESETNKNKINELNKLLQEKDNAITDLKDRVNSLTEELHRRDQKFQKDLLNNEVEKSSQDKETQENVTDFVVNNYANFNDVNIVDALEYVCKLCRVDPSTQNEQRNVAADHVKVLLNKIDKHFYLVEGKIDEINELKMKVKKLKSHILFKIEKLVERCRVVEKKNEENAALLLKLMNKNGDQNGETGEIGRLQTLLQVKIREQKEKQKKYETNYRTLLRKVKEHMKGRNVAEKHNAYLQELHSTLSDECNSLKLQINLRDTEIGQLKNCIESHVNSNEKLKSSALKLEKKLTEFNHSELEIMKEDKMKLEENYEKYKISTLSELKLKEELIDELKKENQDLSFQLSTVTNDNSINNSQLISLKEDKEKLCAKLGNLEDMLTQEKVVSQKLTMELFEKEENYLKILMERDELNNRIESITEKYSYLLKEVEQVNSCLQQKSEELKELQMRKKEIESNWNEKEMNMQGLIISLKSQLQTFKNESDGIKNEKFFLQRLCNDLKVALKVHIHHNKVLKDHVNNLCKQKGEFTSLPSVLSNFPSPTKYDDIYIEKLLQENKAPLHDKPFSDIQGCLDTLRNEISVLQKRIIEKNL